MRFDMLTITKDLSEWLPDDVVQAVLEAQGLPAPSSEQVGGCQGCVCGVCGVFGVWCVCGVCGVWDRGSRAHNGVRCMGSGT
jgi:hypothetical protein